MSNETLEPVAIPTNHVDDSGSAYGNDPTCTVCGKPLSYSGRGRPPTKCDEHKGRSSGSKRASGAAPSPRSQAGVDQAVASLGAVYVLLVQGLMMTGARQSASELASKVSTLNSQNADFLSRDPELVKMINKGGAATGRVGFLAVNLAVLVPIGFSAFNELTKKDSSADGS